MSRWRKLPIEVDAIQLPRSAFGDSAPPWVMAAITAGTLESDPANLQWHVGTLEGRMTAHWGDYLIQGVAGEIYPCRREIFEATYERVVAHRDLAYCPDGDGGYDG